MALDRDDAVSPDCTNPVRIHHPLVLAGSALLVACANQPTDSAPPVAPEPPKAAPDTSMPLEDASVPVHQAAIQAGALTPYSEDQAPELINRFSARIDEVEAFRQLAANAAAADPDCQVISMVEVASTSTTDDLRFWVECSDNNGDPVRYNFTEAELKSQS